MGLFFSCLALIEHEAGLLFSDLVNKTEDARVKLLPLNILQETNKHELILKHVAEIQNENHAPQIGECEKTFGKAFVESLEFTRSLRQEFQKGTPLLQTLEKIMDIEKAVGEEVLMILNSQIRLFLGNMEPEIKKILQIISADEERHMELTSLAITCLKKKQKPVE